MREGGRSEGGRDGEKEGETEKRKEGRTEGGRERGREGGSEGGREGYTNGNRGIGGLVGESHINCAMHIGCTCFQHPSRGLLAVWEAWCSEAQYLCNAMSLEFNKLRTLPWCLIFIVK